MPTGLVDLGNVRFLLGRAVEIIIISNEEILYSIVIEPVIFPTRNFILIDTPYIFLRNPSR